MKNIIIGLCAALVLYGAQAFGCGHQECVEYYINGDANGRLHDDLLFPVYRTPCTKSFSTPKLIADEEIFGMGKKDSSLSPGLLRDLVWPKENLLFRDKLLKDLFPAIMPDEDFLKGIVFTPTKPFEYFIKPVLVSTETTEAGTASSLVTETTEAGAASAALPQTTDK